MLILCKKLNIFEVLWLVSLWQERRLFWFHQRHIFCNISSFIFCFIASFPCKKNKSMVLLNHVDKSILLYYLKNFNNTTRAFTLHHLEIPNPTYHSFHSPKFHVYDRYTARSNIWKETSCKWERWNAAVIMTSWLYVRITNIRFFKSKYLFVQSKITCWRCKVMSLAWSFKTSS